MQAPTKSQMLVVMRHPIGAGLSALALLAFLAFVLSTMDGGATGVRDGDRRVLEIRAESAPLIASDLAQIQERRRRAGLGYARDTDALVAAWLRQFDTGERHDMREWSEYHGAHASATATRFVVETSSGPGADGWYRLEVDRRAGRVERTCGGEPTPGCVRGRWPADSHGLSDRYLLWR
jgi:hypothetical protein